MAQQMKQKQKTLHNEYLMNTEDVASLRKELRECRLQRTELSAKTDGLSGKARQRHREEIKRLKASLTLAQEAVDSEEFYREKYLQLKEENRELKQANMKLKRRVEFIHKEYENILKGLK